MSSSPSVTSESDHESWTTMTQASRQCSTDGSKGHKPRNLQAEKCALFSVYFALLLDNLLLTAVVPILPHYVHHDQQETNNLTIQEDGQQLEFHMGRGYYHPDVGDNSRLGFLLSLKAIVQLAANPLVALLSRCRAGIPLLLLFGTLNLISCALLFAFGKTYELLAAARAFQGITSACFTIAGLGLVASIYSRNDESGRSVALGRALGGGAMGVLLGYPTAGFLYQLWGKTVPFLIISALSFILLLVFLLTLTLIHRMEKAEEEGQMTRAFPPDETNSNSGTEEEDYGDRKRMQVVLVVAVGSIFLSTAVMALLEPCLPLWLMETMNPQRWQLGAVFIPDSCGYLLATHFLGGVAYRYGRWKVALLSMLLLAVSCMMVPLAGSIIHLTGPHFGIGFGIGAVDAALVPLLATLADLRNEDSSGQPASYGGTFALGQTAVSLAYCLGPLLGGFLVESIGFPTLMVAVGVLNLLYSPLIPLFLKPLSQQWNKERKELTERTALTLFSSSKSSSSGYVRFQDDE